MGDFLRFSVKVERSVRLCAEAFVSCNLLSIKEHKLITDLLIEKACENGHDDNGRNETHKNKTSAVHQQAIRHKMGTEF